MGVLELMQKHCKVKMIQGSLSIGEVDVLSDAARFGGINLNALSVYWKYQRARDLAQAGLVEISEYQLTTHRRAHVRATEAGRGALALLGN